MTIIWSVVTGIIVSIGFLYFPEIWLRWLTFLIISISIAVINLSLVRVGRAQLASWVLTCMVWLYITIPCYTAGGIFAPGIISQLSVILTAGYLLGWRGGLAIGILSMSVDLGFVYLENIGALPEPQVNHTPITRWIGAIIPFGTILALQYYATNHLRTSLIALQQEINLRKNVEKSKNQTVAELKERVKELKTLYTVGRILQSNHTTDEIFKQIVETIPPGWQFPEITASRLVIGNSVYCTKNYDPSGQNQKSTTKSEKGKLILLEVIYLERMPEIDEGPFLNEERQLLDMLVDMIKTYVDRTGHMKELTDYQYALNIALMVSISDTNGNFVFVNDNFCNITKYSSEELIGKPFQMIMSDQNPKDYFEQLAMSLQSGKPYRGEFCNISKDGSKYWVDASVVPFVNDQGEVYQYLSINQDITDRKTANQKIMESEQMLRKITSQVPGNTYLLELHKNSAFKVLFMNRGFDDFNHAFQDDKLAEFPEQLVEFIHPDDIDIFNQALSKAYTDNKKISIQFRYNSNGEIKWRWMQATPEKNKDGTVLCYGSSNDISAIVDYIVSIEQIIFDIGHVIRKPISNMIGLTTLISMEGLSNDEILSMTKKLKNVCVEIDTFLKELNSAYELKRQDTSFNFDASSSIDRRSSLFGG